MSERACGTEHSTFHPTLYLAFELGNKKWKLGFTIGLGQSPRRRTIAAGDLVTLQREIRLAKKRFGLPQTAQVMSCYEAGRDGFWLHRYLVSEDIENLVVDSASIEVNRRAKRAKTDRLDVGKLLTMLIRYDYGEKKVWSVVHVPSVEAEDKRHLHRQLGTLKTDRTRHINRIKGLLVGQGVRIPVRADFLERLETVRLWDGSPLPPGLRSRLEREYAGLQFVNQQIKELEAERREMIRTSDDPSVEQVRVLMRLRGIGENSAWLFVMEFFGWREFRNRRQVGGLTGLTPTPYQSGDESQEQGISKAGNRPIRAMAIEIAWGWLRHQPHSELSLWYQRRFGHGSKRLRKIGIVALARKLLVAFWRYLEYGEIPAGAQLKA
ncbi:MAG: IS110 family transposase [Chloroflexi bacterium]|nr:IS110 family transposase [Anaerolineae bacterium]RLC67257.1 MAG: IS110 family transposase [Chloroflexota bacterium]